MYLLSNIPFVDKELLQFSPLDTVIDIVLPTE